jgi:cell division protein FtsB
MAKKELATVSLIIAGLILIFLPSFAKYQELSAKNRMLDRKMQFAKEEIKRLQLEKVRLETDIAYIEKRARDKIGMVRKGEILIKPAQTKK